jgi:hypothetical protein
MHELFQLAVILIGAVAGLFILSMLIGPLLYLLGFSLAGGLFFGFGYLMFTYPLVFVPCFIALMIFGLVADTSDTKKPA